MLAGDEAAFTTFFDAVYPALYRFALARLDGDADAAGDVAQAAICKAIAKLQTFRGEAALLTWVCVFCRREIFARHRHQAGRVHVPLVEDEPEVRAALESLRLAADDDPGASLDRRSLGAFVQRVLDHLPAHYADALEWKYIDGLPVQAIATRLGLGAKAAESLLTRARAAFRDAFATLSADGGRP
jgi:RNA polymerase sigma-70 factor (ECF subfamily)